MLPTSHLLVDQKPPLHYLAFNRPEDFPANRTLLFLHGVTSHAHYWDEIAPLFTPDFQVYALDWRGHGDSGPAESYSEVEDYLSDLDRLLNRLAPARLSLVGHSLGGFIALAFAARGHPYLEKIVMCDVKFSVGNEEKLNLEKAARKSQPRQPNREELVNRFIKTLPDSTAPRAVLARLALEGAKQNEDGTYSLKYDRRVLTFPGPRPLDYAPQVTVPLLVLNGANSQMVSKADAARVASLAPLGRHLEIPAAGHHVFLDQPEAFTRALKEFLSQVADLKGFG